MLPLSQVELDELPVAALVERMDALLQESRTERYGTNRNVFPESLVSQIISTQRVSALLDDLRKRIANISFAYLVELELNSVSSGFANTVLFNGDYDEQASWLSPTFRLREGAIRQYQIVSSRIAMEIFMDLLYCIETGERLVAKRSKLKAFRNWLCDVSNPFHYFAHALLEAYRFDRSIRTPEVHGTPRSPKRLLLLQHPSYEELNDAHRLTNVLFGCWAPLVDLLNNKRPPYMQISETEEEWFSLYMTGSEDEIAEKLTAMFEGIE